MTVPHTYSIELSCLSFPHVMTRSISRKIESVLEKNENTDSLKRQCFAKYHQFSSARDDNTWMWGSL